MPYDLFDSIATHVPDVPTLLRFSITCKYATKYREDHVLQKRLKWATSLSGLVGGVYMGEVRLGKKVTPSFVQVIAIGAKDLTTLRMYDAVYCKKIPGILDTETNKVSIDKTQVVDRKYCKKINKRDLIKLSVLIADDSISVRRSEFWGHRVMNTNNSYNIYYITNS